ncbi:hypothetical protein FBU30_005890 [Linnemannia zychae]|nr:hypothetical protein FBU30_005890 [Linnemannia zychae]
MLQHFAPRLSSQARFLFKNVAIAPSSPFPRRPVFFSFTAKSRYSTTVPPSNPTTTTTEPATTVFKATIEESEPAHTNLSSRSSSSSCTVSPPPTYAFLKPTPVVLLTAPFGGNWCYRDTWQASLADQGYQSTSIELSMPPESLESGDAYIRYFVKTLKTAIETDHSFYPPILIAHGLHALVAQKYVESNPVSALVLVEPFIPEIIKHRFQELSHELQRKHSTTNATPANDSKEKKEDLTSSTKEESSLKSVESVSPSNMDSTKLPDFQFKTHADVLAQDGFREQYVLPKKAVYKIDQIAKEHQEKEEAELKKKQQQESEAASTPAADGSSSTASTGVKEPTEATETLGHDSVPIWDSKEEKQKPTQDQSTGAQEDVPIQTVESEASIPSPLEQLPLSIYDSIPPSIFEPTFPILLVTSNGDRIVSTEDVKDHHVLSGEVDHIELNDLDDGGHLIMVSDNAEWEQGIQGITAWLDSNGM